MTKAATIDRHIALDHLTLVVDQNEVGHPDVAEMHAERIDPEVIEPLGITGGDVPGHPLVEAELGEEPKPRRQALLAMEPFLVRSVEHLVRGDLHDLRHHFLLVAGTER